jgi:L-rhamnose-H+ transport protein
MTFSLLGMLVFNWTLGFLTVPEIGALASVPARDIGVLVLFGAGWGVGAVLFGLGMERLGMSLGYPVIMGLIACMAALWIGSFYL